MKAQFFMKYGSPEVLKLEEIKKPIPKDDEILIEIYTASVNDWDLGLIWGKPFVIRFLYGLVKPKKVNIPGVDVAGKVEAIGKNVTKFKVGDEVFGDISENGFGSFAEYVCVKENAVSLKPLKMTFTDAAALPHASMLAVQGLIDLGNIREGQKVLINGAGGGVGTLGIQLAKQHNVTDVTGVDSSGKLDLLLSLGYKNVLDYKKTDFTNTGKKYDVILDVKTNRSIFKYAKALNKNGIYITVGGAMRRIFQATFLGWMVRLFQNKKIQVLGLKPNKDLDYIKKIYEEGNLKPVIDSQIFKLKDTKDALQYFATGEHKGKIIIKIKDIE